MKIRLESIKINDKEFFKAVDFEHDIHNICCLFKLLLVKQNNIFVPTVCIQQENAEENYDYNSEDELEYMGIDYSYEYFAIQYNPFTGEKIEFEVVKCSDKTERYNELSLLLQENEKRRQSKDKYYKSRELQKQIANLLDGVPEIVDYNKTQRYNNYDTTYACI